MVGITEKTFADMALIANKSGGVVPILSGEEITVSGVKSTVCMLFCIELFCIWLAAMQGRHTEARRALEKLERLPNAIEELLQDKTLKEISNQLAQRYADCRAAVIIDAQQCNGTGQETALKLEENSWHAIGKTLDYNDAPRFIEKERSADTLVIVNATCKRRLDEAVGIMETLHRHSVAFMAVSIAHRQQALIERYSDGRCVYLQRLSEVLQPFVDLVFYYQFAFYFGLAHGREIGVPPRNRAKSITVSRSLDKHLRLPAERLRLLKETNQAGAVAEAVIEDAGKCTTWEEKAASDIERHYYQQMRRLMVAMASPPPVFSRLKGLDEEAAQKLGDTLFSDASDVGEVIFVPLDRGAEAAARAVADQWRLLIDYPFFVSSPWEAVAHVPEGALPVFTAGSTPSAKIVEEVLAKVDCPYVWAGAEPADGIPADLKKCLGRFNIATDSGLANRDLLYSQLNELFIKVWQSIAPDKAAVFERHVLLSAQVILSVLNNADLLDTINEAGDYNDEIEKGIKAAIEDFKANGVY